MTDPAATGWYFEDYEVGFVFEGPAQTVERDELLRYAAENDPFPIHLDPEAARAVGFDDVIAPWGYTVSLLFRSMHGMAPNQAPQTGFLGGLEWRVVFARPIRPDDRIHVRSTVTSTRRTSRGDRGVVTTRNEIVNQDGDVPIVVEIVAMYRCRTPADS